MLGAGVARGNEPRPSARLPRACEKHHRRCGAKVTATTVPRSSGDWLAQAGRAYGLTGGPDGVIAQVPESSAITGESDLTSAVTVHLLADLYDRPELLEPPPPVVRSLAYRSRTTLFAGPRKLGKTTFATAGAAALSRGRAFLGETVESGEVLWICLDEPVGDLVRRFRSEDADPERIRIVQPPVTVAKVVALAKQHMPALVVVDTLSDLLSGEVESENHALEAKRALAPLRTLARDSEVSLLLLHHVTKSTGRSRGSSVFEDMADLILHLSADADDPTVRAINSEGRVATSDLRVRWGTDGFQLVDGEPPMMQRVRQAVWARPGLSLRELRELVPGRNADVSVALQRLLAVGEVVNHGTKSKGEYHHAKSEREPLGNHT